MLRNGSLTLGHWKSIPVRLHWSLPLGLLVMGGFAVRPAYWGAYVLLVLVHEAGHAWLVARAGGEVLSVELTGLGGECHWSGDVTRVQRACIAWGGVWAQAAAGVVALALVALHGRPTTMAGLDVLAVFTWTNLKIAAFNLLPVPPLDGSKAWALLPLLWRRARKRLERHHEARRTKALRAAAARKLAQLEAAEAAEPSAEVRETVSSFLAEVRTKGRP